MGNRLFFSLIFLLTVVNTFAQYYDEGRDPFGIRWRQKKNERYKIIYPEGYDEHVGVVSAVIDTAYKSLHYGLSKTAGRLPIVLHGYNLQSNGVVSWAPKHAELVITPPVNSFAVPWLKQLAIHEYRHVVQISNLNRNVVKYAGYVIGEQAAGAAGLLLPIWFLEGDATFAETAMASYGRGIQPEFTLEYRAYLDGCGTDIFPVDKWFTGSYKDYIPNHYYLGYQIVNYSYRTYGGEFWEKIIDYSTRKPYLIVPRNLAYKKYFGTSSKKLFNDSFRELKSIWDSLPEANNSAVVTETAHQSYTLYSYPYFINDSTVFAVKYDLVNTSRFVLVNINSREEITVAYTGAISSRPIYRNGQLMWTEYRASTFWEQKNYSVLCTAELDCRAGKLRNKKVGRNNENIFFPTPLNDGIAYVKYNKGTYSIILTGSFFSGNVEIDVPFGISVHGMACDAETGTLAMIGLGESGMFIAGLDKTQEMHVIKEPSYTSINNLHARDGKLIFNSIQSGKDEIHYIDLNDKKEYRITESRYGSIMPSFDDKAVRSVQVTYQKDGYFLSVQGMDSDIKQEVIYSELPQNILNAPIARFDVVNIDTMELNSLENYGAKPRRYRKGAHLFNIHSWAPLSFDPFRLSDESEFEPDLGLTLISQNTLSSISGFLTYGRSDGNNFLKGKLLIDIFAPKIEINTQYGGGKSNYMAVAPEGNITIFPTGKMKDYFYLNTRVYLPFNISSGYMLRSVTPAVSLSHYNNPVYDYLSGTFKDGYQKMEISLSYSANSRMAHRDISPKWGYYTRFIYAGSPFSKHFGKIYAIYGGGYIPGILANHSLRLSGLYQYQKKDLYNFRSNILFPTEVRYNFTPKWMMSVAGEYKFPIAYPDHGIPGLIYIKRVYMGLYGGYSRYRSMNIRNMNEVWSYGGEIALNTHPLRMSNADLDIKGGLFFPCDSSKPVFRFTMSVNI